MFVMTMELVQLSISRGAYTKLSLCMEDVSVKQLLVAVTIIT